MMIINPQAPVLTVICNHQILGCVSVREDHLRDNGGRRIIGDFSPGPDYSNFKAMCELMAQWKQEFIESSHVDYAGDTDPYWAWDKWMEAIEQLASLGLGIAELPNEVEEWSIDHKGEVTMFLL